MSTDHTPATPEELADIESRAEAATPGPWTAEESFEVDDVGTTASFVDGPRWWYDNYLESRADAEFIAHARQDVPCLVATVRLWREQEEHQSRERSKLIAELRQLRGAAHWVLEQLGDNPPGTSGADLVPATEQLRKLLPPREGN